MKQLATELAALLTLSVSLQSTCASESPRGSAIVYLPAGLQIPLVSGNADAAGTIIARVASQVRLADGNSLPSGTILIGHQTLSSKSNISVTFDTMKFADGTTIPINSSIIGGTTVSEALTEKTFSAVIGRRHSTAPSRRSDNAARAERATIRLNAPAQVVL